MATIPGYGTIRCRRFLFLLVFALFLYGIVSILAFGNTLGPLVDGYRLDLNTFLPPIHSNPSVQVNRTFITTADTILLNESFSACLLVMDENFRLYEWLAYHYHVLPLRYLVIASDPRSKQSPEPVLELFRQHLNMTILLWNDTDFLWWLPPLPENAEVSEMTDRFKIRQRRFLAQCLAHMHQQNRTWTALWDTDEYVAFNLYNFSRQSLTSNSSATSPCDMSEAGSILRYLKGYGEPNCVVMNRALVGNREAPTLMNETHPFDPRRFDTIRYRWRLPFGARLNGFGKCMMNVQKIPSFPVTVRNPHRPVFEICPGAKGDHLLHRPFYLNHYIGSWEAYSYRDDGRRGGIRSHEAYLERAQQGTVYDDNLSPWLPAFLASVGIARATILLENAGLDPNYNASSLTASWKRLKSD